jgi:hypothetical protein
MSRKHADLIHAWADGAEIQYLHHDEGIWTDCLCPAWLADHQYRIKPKAPQTFTVPQLILWIEMYANSLNQTCVSTDGGYLSEQEIALDVFKGFLNWVEKQ